MRITINGEVRRVEEGQAIGPLLEQLGLRPERVAVEVNREIVDRAAMPHRTLREGDCIEIIQFVGGGA